MHMELTQEYFDKGLQNLDDSITRKIELKLDQKIDQQTAELKQYVHESFETQQTFIEEQLKDFADMEDIKKHVHKLEIEIEKLKLQRHSPA